MLVGGVGMRGMGVDECEGVGVKGWVRGMVSGMREGVSVGVMGMDVMVWV